MPLCKKLCYLLGALASVISQEAQENLGEAVSSLYEVITLLNNGSVNDDTIDAIIDAIIYMEDSV